MVRVPVLSITKVVACPRFSNAPPLRMTTPAREARDSPETIATGAASSSGHGVATTSTATARTADPLASQAATRQQQRQRQEPRRVAVGQPHDRRVLRPGLLRQPHDAGVGAVFGGCGGAQLERGAGVDHTAADRFADAAFDLQRFTGQHRLVQHGHHVDDPPVHRHHLARADDQQIIDAPPQPAGSR